MKMITIKEAAALTGKKISTIRYYMQMGYIRAEKDKVIKVSEDDLMSYINDKIESGTNNPFGVAFPREAEAFKPMYSLAHGKIKYSKNMIMVGSYGSIWNITQKHIFTEDSVDTHGHIQVTIDKKGYYIHRLVAIVWCPNRHFKQVVHHINGNPTDNRYTNLLWVTSVEHCKLHQLSNLNNMNEYNTLVEQIRKENQWEKEILYPVINNELSDDSWLSVYMVNYEGYKLLLNGFVIETVIKKQLLKIEYGVCNDGKKGEKNVSKSKKNNG